MSGLRAHHEDFTAALPAPLHEPARGLIAAIAGGVSAGGHGRAAAHTAVISLVQNFHAVPATWGTTVALDRLIDAHNAWLLRDGQQQQLTQEHALDHPDLGSRLTRVLGLEDSVRVDFRQGALQVGDVLLLSRDGVRVQAEALLAGTGRHRLYLARVDGSRELVAIKTLHESRAIDAEERAMLAHEAWLGAQVSGRDVKPANLRHDDDGLWRLLDLGAAIAGREPAALCALRAGTLSCMNPEQRDEPGSGEAAGHADAMSDLYALGVTLYRWLTGRLPCGEIVPYQSQR